MLRRKHLIPVGIVAFWLVMTGLLLQKEVLLPRAQLDPTDAPTVASDIWMGIYTPAAGGDEKKVGYLHTTTLPGENDTRYGLTLKFATTMFSIPGDILMQGHTQVSHTKGLTDFSFEVSSANSHIMKAVGRAQDKDLQISIHTAGEIFPLTIPLSDDLLVSGGMGTTTLHIPSLEIGGEVYVTAFDPLTFTYNQNVRIACEAIESMLIDGKETTVKVLSSTSGGLTSRIWVTNNAEVVRVETPFGLILRRITQEEAIRELEPGELGEFIDTVAIRPTGLIPFRGAQRMKVHLSGLPPDVAPISDTNQTQSNDLIYDIVRPPVPAKTGPPLDRPGPYLNGDPFVQVDHDDFVDLNETLLADNQSDWQRAQALYQWTYDSIDKTIVMSFPSALDVLLTREGDCNEHTVLYTALARTAGIPTKMAIGIVWSNELNGFYYHAWPEVYIGRWIPIDPTLGQPIADATHIKFIEGSIDAWPKLLGYLGQVQVEVLEVE